MRAWQVHGTGPPAEVLIAADVADPEPGPDECRLRVIAAGVGLPDVLMCRGTYAFSPPPGFTPGQEVVGEVLTVGAEVTGLRVGDRVMAVTAFAAGSGGFAEQCLARARNCFPAPADLPDDLAGGFAIPYHTAWVGLVERAGLGAGEWLVVLGAGGGSGLAAVDLGLALDARVVAVVGDEERFRRCRDRGAVVVDRRAGEVADRLLDLTDGHGADVVFDPVGGDLAAATWGAIANEGRFLLVGFASGRWAELASAALVRANASLLGVYVGAYGPERLGPAHDRLLELWRTGRLSPTVEAVRGFERLPEAVTRVADGRVTGKLVWIP